MYVLPLGFLRGKVVIKDQSVFDAISESDVYSRSFRTRAPGSQIELGNLWDCK